ncbi:MAG TPA: hypothetical protein VFH31_03305 [Pyrinomonadaceae bacterium]|nr:hypothetical protein [Pyrinomonadaceae bacterium]
MFLRATFIQDISEFLIVVRPFLWDVIRDNRYGFTERIILEWILREELFQTNLIVPRHHRHQQMPFVHWHGQLRSNFPYPFSKYVAYHLRFPKLYDPDSEIELEVLNQNELWIRYYTHTPKYNHA